LIVLTGSGRRRQKITAVKVVAETRHRAGRCDAQRAGHEGVLLPWPPNVNTADCPFTENSSQFQLRVCVPKTNKAPAVRKKTGWKFARHFMPSLRNREASGYFSNAMNCANVDKNCYKIPATAFLGLIFGKARE
jgi:hypothetical protein